jgi:hypothetical protein
MCQARAVKCNELKEPSTMEITTVGFDIAKRVFQLHGVDAAGKAVLRRKLQRSEVLAFFKALRLVWSALRLAARRIIGRVRSASWGMRCD